MCGGRNDTVGDVNGVVLSLLFPVLGRNPAMANPFSVLGNGLMVAATILPFIQSVGCLPGDRQRVIERRGTSRPVDHPPFLGHVPLNARMHAPVRLTGEAIGLDC